MDLDTFLTTVYVDVDDWYKQWVKPHKVSDAGATAQLSDSEVLRVVLAGHWRRGTAWRSERGVVRWMIAHGWFPS